MSKNDFEIEYIKVQKKLFAIALSILRKVDLAEEAVSIAVLKAYQKKNSLRKPEYFQTWIVKILLRSCYDLQKQNKFVNYQELHEEDLSVFDKYEYEFFCFITNLNKKEKEIVVLRYFYQLQLDEIAKILSKPLSTVKSCLYRSLKKLEEEISDERQRL